MLRHVGTLQRPRRESEQLIPFATEATTVETINPALSDRKARLCGKRDVRGINRAIREREPGRRRKRVSCLSRRTETISAIYLPLAAAAVPRAIRDSSVLVCLCVCACLYVYGRGDLSRFSLFLHFNRIGRVPNWMARNRA